MEAIAACDLDAHHAPLRAELAAAAARVLASGRFILGPEVAAFEREAAAALGVAHAVGVSSGSDALLAMLMACGVGRDDEVVTTPFSFFATAGAIVRVGARPVFADIDPRTLTLDEAAACRAIGPRTRAVLVVHLFGRAAPTGALESVCARAGVPLLEDAAQAIGAHAAAADGGARPVGTLGAAAALSFFPSKNLGGFGDGGMVLTADGGLAQRVRLVRTHGAAGKAPHVTVGGNFRLDELQAALLRVKLPHLPAWTRRRREIAARYRELLAGLPIVLPPPDAGAVWNQFVIRAPGGARDLLAQYLAVRGISTAIYYPRPLHLQPALAALGGRAGQLPEAELAAAEVLALPIHAELTDAAVARVCGAVHGFFAETQP